MFTSGTGGRGMGGERSGGQRRGGSMEVIHTKRDVQKEGLVLRIPNNLW